MSTLTFTLLSDGSSDRALLPVLQWLLLQNSARNFEAQWADLRWIRRPPKSLRERAQAALRLYPCNLLFVHRDAEKMDRATRVAEIREHLRDTPEQTAVCVVPVRMQEAWLLFDEAAIRRTADNPRGTMDLDLPPLTSIEDLPDPKTLLWRLLTKASGLRAGRLHRFSPSERIHRLSEVITDFSPLRSLPAFRLLEEDLRTVLTTCSWR